MTFRSYPKFQPSQAEPLMLEHLNFDVKWTRFNMPEVLFYLERTVDLYGDLYGDFYGASISLVAVPFGMSRRDIAIKSK